MAARGAECSTAPRRPVETGGRVVGAVPGPRRRWVGRRCVKPAPRFPRCVRRNPAAASRSAGREGRWGARRLRSSLAENARREMRDRAAHRPPCVFAPSPVTRSRHARLEDNPRRCRASTRGGGFLQRRGTSRRPRSPSGSRTSRQVHSTAGPIRRSQRCATRSVHETSLGSGAAVASCATRRPAFPAYDSPAAGKAVWRTATLPCHEPRSSRASGRCGPASNWSCSIPSQADALGGFRAKSVDRTWRVVTVPRRLAGPALRAAAHRCLGTASLEGDLEKGRWLRTRVGCRASTNFPKGNLLRKPSSTVARTRPSNSRNPDARG